ncbi:hypothetical protein [Sulfitobacter sp. D35]|uniref:hypothetical protein n=1 Tax=Sulfitobacter sp. D35 TaxID=3083252 RepID=UPI003990A474
MIYLRLWCDGPESQAKVWSDFSVALGPARGRKALRTFEDLFGLCTARSRRPMMRHAVNCACVGSDEACFCNFIATALEGDREDALLIATLMVRADFAPALTALATEYGLALKSMMIRPTVYQCPSQNRERLH